MRRLMIVLCCLGLAACGSSPPQPESGSKASGHALDLSFLTYAGAVGPERRDEFRGLIRKSLVDGVEEELPVVVHDLGDSQLLISWFAANRDHGVQVVDLKQQRVWTAMPGVGLHSTVEEAALSRVGLLNGGAFVAPKPKPAGSPLNPGWADATWFQGRWLSYKYENGKFFRNEFYGDVRHSSVSRGLLKEPVVVRPLGAGKLLVSWVDEKFGHLAQVVDLSRGTIWTAVPFGPHTEIWQAEIQGSGELEDG